MFLGLNDVAFLAAVSGPAVPTDPNFANVSLLLHGDGANGSTTIVDSSPSPKTVTTVGNAQISTAQSKFGGASIAFDDVIPSYLTLPSSADFALGDTWTVEGWMFCNVVGSGSDRNALLLLGAVSGAGSLAIYVEGGGNFTVRAGAAGSDVVAAGLVIASQWQFWAVSCLSNVATIYLNGQSVASGPVSGSVTAQSGRVASVGAGGLAAYDLDGYIDELRITKGVARYQSAFTPPTAPFPDA
jgi:hypothetical protein